MAQLFGVSRSETPAAGNSTDSARLQSSHRWTKSMNWCLLVSAKLPL